MKRLLLYFWWCLNTPANVRIFYISGCFDRDALGGIWPVSQIAFDRCSRIEKDFILWRDPIFKHFDTKEIEKKC